MLSFFPSLSPKLEVLYQIDKIQCYLFLKCQMKIQCEPKTHFFTENQSQACLTELDIVEMMSFNYDDKRGGRAKDVIILTPKKKKTLLFFFFSFSSLEKESLGTSIKISPLFLLFLSIFFFIRWWDLLLMGLEPQP